MQKQNINWFATVLGVVICFIILTDLTEFSVEVLCGWSVWSRRCRYEEKEERQEIKLGDDRGTPSKYSRRLKLLSLGMPRKASCLLQQISVCFRIRFVHAICSILEHLLHLVFIFFYAPCRYEIVLGWFIECSLHFTYIFWVWLYRMLHVLHLYHLKFGLPVSLHIKNRCLKNALLVHLYLLEHGLL